MLSASVTPRLTGSYGFWVGIVFSHYWHAAIVVPVAHGAHTGRLDVGPQVGADWGEVGEGAAEIDCGDPVLMDGDDGVGGLLVPRRVQFGPFGCLPCRGEGLTVPGLREHPDVQLATERAPAERGLALRPYLHIRQVDIQGALDRWDD